MNATIEPDDATLLSLASPEALEAFREAALADFGTFARWAWPIVEPTPLEWSRVLAVMCEHMQAVSDGEIQRLWINVPPGFAKSLVVSVIWPAYQWARDPTWRMLCSSYARELAVRDSVRCRQILRDPDYRDLFGRGWELTGDQDAKTFYRTTAGGHRFATSTGSGTTGHRGNCVLIDDPLSVADAYSEPKRRQALDHVARVLPSRLNDQRSDVVVGIMQRVHQDDPTSWAKEHGFEILRMPMEFEPKRAFATSIGRDWRVAPGQLLDPVRYPPVVVEELRRKPGYSAEYQQQPRSAGGIIVRDTWIRDYDRLPHEVENFGRWIQSWDLRAGGKGSGSSFAVGQVWVAHGAARYLVDQVRGRWTTAETMEQIRSLSARYPQAKERIVEDKADGRPVLNLLGAELALIPHKPVGGKESRLVAQAYQFESGNVYVPTRFPSESSESSVTGWRYEITTFPQAPNDDQVDAASQALERLSGAAGSAPWTSAPSGQDGAATVATKRGRGMF